MTFCEQVTQAELHRQFHALGAGVIEDVRVTKDKGFGFVRYRTHEEAAYAIQAANGRVMCGKSVKVCGRGACHWSVRASVMTSGCVFWCFHLAFRNISEILLSIALFISCWFCVTPSLPSPLIMTSGKVLYAMSCEPCNCTRFDFFLLSYQISDDGSREILTLLAGVAVFVGQQAHRAWVILGTPSPSPSRWSLSGSDSIWHEPWIWCC